MFLDDFFRWLLVVSSVDNRVFNFYLCFVFNGLSLFTHVDKFLTCVNQLDF